MYRFACKQIMLYISLDAVSISRFAIDDWLHSAINHLDFRMQTIVYDLFILLKSNLDKSTKYYSYKYKLPTDAEKEFSTNYSWKVFIFYSVILSQYQYAV